MGCGILALMAAGALVVLVLYAWHAVLGPETGNYFDSEGVRIYYTDEGRGAPVLLVHGYACNSHLEWRKRGLTAALARDYRVISPDSRGHGRSDKPHDPGKYGVQMVEDLVRLLDHLNIEKAHVIGYSMGGFITLKLAVMHPERLLSVAPCGAGWEQPTAENLAFGEMVAKAVETGEGIGPLRTRLLGEERPVQLKEKLGTKVMLGYFNDPKALAAAMRGFHELAITESELRENRVPSLTIVGGNDGFLSVARLLTEHMGNHKLVVLEGKDHSTTPVAVSFIEELRIFLATHASISQADTTSLHSFFICKNYLD